MRKTIILAYLIFLLTLTACADNVSFDLRLDKDSVSKGKQVELAMVFTGIDSIPGPQVPFVNGLDIRYVQEVKNEGSVILIYRVVALRTGEFTIGPIAFSHGKDTYTSNTVVLKVAEEEPGDKEFIYEKKDIDLSKHIFVVLDIPKHTIYVNENLPIRLKLYSDWLDVENIAFMEPKSQYLITKGFSDKAVSVAENDGINYVVLEYKSWITAVIDGDFMLDPIKVKLDVAKARAKDDSGNFDILNSNKDLYDEFIGIGDSRAVTLETKLVEIKAVPLPVSGRPEDFGGAIGDFSFDLKTSTTKIKPGDTIKLTMTITGKGNYDTVSMPVMAKMEGARLYKPDVRRGEDSISYEQALSIDLPAVNKIPEVSFSFFDPDKKKYVTIRKGPVALEVEGWKEELKKISDEKDKEKKKTEIVGLKDKLGSVTRKNMKFYGGPLMWGFEVFPALLILAGIVIYRRIRFLEEDPEYAALLRASKKARMEILKAEHLLARGDARGFYALTFKIAQEYLGKRLFLPSEGITGQIAERLNAPGDGEDVSGKVKEIFSDCYIARYTSSKYGKDDMRETLNRLKYVVAELNKRRKI
ncbi:MAG: BatD family protein [Proteobacteria bacterium]|nr:BatD family protein [Pseudomonadota bacterium]